MVPESLRCIYSGMVVVGPFTHSDDADIDWDDNKCQACGATARDDCTLPEGESLSPYVHAAREG